LSNITHGLSRIGLPEYAVWVEMRRRCEDPRRPGYKNYGERGIRVCDRWHNFVNFYADMGPRPKNTRQREWQIERIDNYGNYEPSNCKWATIKTQGNNRRTNHLLEAFGRTLTIQQWCDEYGIPDTTFHNRLKRGWTIEDALTKPRMIMYASSRKS
jgi:NADH:ubiquinone oxidoreductase subunit